MTQTKKTQPSKGSVVKKVKACNIKRLPPPELRTGKKMDEAVMISKEPPAARGSSESVPKKVTARGNVQDKTRSLRKRIPAPQWQPLEGEPTTTGKRAAASKKPGTVFITSKHGDMGSPTSKQVSVCETLLALRFAQTQSGPAKATAEQSGTDGHKKKESSDE